MQVIWCDENGSQVVRTKNRVAMELMLTYGDGPRALYARLKGQILSGDLESGREVKILPLSREFGVSIGPVREAIRMLASDNLVVLRPRRSPVVATFDQNELVEINQIRLALEPMVLESAVDKHTAESLEACRDVLRQDEASEDLWEKVELNRQFHLKLLEPTPLRRTLRIIEEQFDGMSRVVQFIVVDRGTFLGHPHHEHLRILKAVESKDTDAAVTLMRRHITDSTERARAELIKREASKPSAAE
ncbi:MAG: GntR family transcriptional regulator [Hyphomicrobiales bacterium]